MTRPVPSHRAARHRAERPARVRPHVLRIAFAGCAFVITLVAVLAGVGVIPVQSRSPAAALERPFANGGSASASGRPTPAGSGESAASTTNLATSGATGSTALHRASSDTSLPAASGVGRRVVFDIARQRVWLVGADGAVERTYLVSGSLTHNLRAGTYAVYSRSRWAVGIDDSGVMQYFVRFAHGTNAAIGFHTIPTLHGEPLQTVGELGTPRSHGCIRQALPDAIRLWDFAPIGTTVVVTV